MSSRVRADAAFRATWPIVLRGGGGRARARPWWNDATVAQLTFVDQGVVPASTVLRVWLAELRARGFDSVRTGAVTEAGADILQRQGFDTLQTLRLLDLPLIGWRPPDDLPFSRTRRLRPGERRQAAEIDRDAFGDRWAIDVVGIDETCAATPFHRARTINGGRVPPIARPITRTRADSFRDIDGDSDGGADGNPDGARAHDRLRRQRLAGYAVTGRAGRTGYLQRLAVHSSHQGHGIGFSLTRDSLVWMQRRRLSRAIVNTHADNLVALRLYQRMGFRLLPQALAVMRRTLTDV